MIIFPCSIKLVSGYAAKAEKRTEKKNRQNRQTEQLPKINGCDFSLECSFTRLRSPVIKYDLLFEVRDSRLGRDICVVFCSGNFTLSTPLYPEINRSWNYLKNAPRGRRGCLRWTGVSSRRVSNKYSKLPYATEIGSRHRIMRPIGSEQEF